VKRPRLVPIVVRPRKLVLAIRHALRLPLPPAVLLMLNTERSR